MTQSDCEEFGEFYDIVGEKTACDIVTNVYEAWDIMRASKDPTNTTVTVGEVTLINADKCSELQYMLSGSVTLHQVRHKQLPHRSVTYDFEIEDGINRGTVVISWELREFDDSKLTILAVMRLAALHCENINEDQLLAFNCLDFIVTQFSNGHIDKEAMDRALSILRELLHYRTHYNISIKALYEYIGVPYKVGKSEREFFEQVGHLDDNNIVPANTKRVQYLGDTYNVPQWATYIGINIYNNIYAFASKPNMIPNAMEDNFDVSIRSNVLCELVGYRWSKCEFQPIEIPNNVTTKVMVDFAGRITNELPLAGHSGDPTQPANLELIDFSSIIK